MLSRLVRFQLTIFVILSVLAMAVIGIRFMRVPTDLGIGRYAVTVELPNTGGLYKTSNVTLRGVTVGIVERVDVSREGAVAHLSMESKARIPVSSRANVHSQSAIGEQFIDFVPEVGGGPYLAEGSVIPRSQTTVPQDVAPMLDTLRNTLSALPRDQLDQVIDEGRDAFAGLDPEIADLLTGSSALLRDASGNVAPTIELLEDAAPVLNSQVVSSQAIRSWASQMRAMSGDLARTDTQIRTLIETGTSAAGQVEGLFQDLEPTLPVLLAGLTGLGQVAVTYNPAIEQVLVLLPQMMSAMQTIGLPNRGGTERGYLSFNLNLNAPAPCTTGFLPAAQRRSGAQVDAPPRPDRPLYCAVPQNSAMDVRGARNIPCLDKPGKRAPTVAICADDRPYAPQGNNPWIGSTAGADGGDAAAPAADRTDHAIRPGVYQPVDGTYGAGGRNFAVRPSIVKSGEDGRQAWQRLLTAP